MNCAESKIVSLDMHCFTWVIVDSSIPIMCTTVVEELILPDWFGLILADNPRQVGP